MIDVKDNNLIKISDKHYVLYKPSTQELEKYIKSDMSTIYFGEHFEENDMITKITPKLLKQLKKDILVIINSNDDYKYSKFILKNISKLLTVSSCSRQKYRQPIFRFKSYICYT